MKTIRQIAEEIGVDKQRVYRYIKKHHIKETCQKKGMMCFSDTAEAQIKQHFMKNSISNNTVSDTVILMLKSDLDSKNQLLLEQQQTIRELTATIKIQAENIKHKPPKKVYSKKRQMILEPKSTVIKRLIKYQK